jgi:hypothetical protein
MGQPLLHITVHEGSHVALSSDFLVAGIEYLMYQWDRGHNCSGNFMEE